MNGNDFSQAPDPGNSATSAGSGHQGESDNGSQNLRLLFFGHLPDVTGISETSWCAASSGLTVAELLEQLHARWPDLKAHDSSIRVAVNLEYADRSDIISGGAEVAIMPPVQGG